MCFFLFDFSQPQLAKQNVIIEKTAKFIAAQGAQMEILIKAKQSNNPQFEFLNQNNRLNRYYKHMLSAIKTGIYPTEEISEENTATPPPPSDSQQTTQQQQFSQFGAMGFSNYDSPRKPLPALKYKPSADCSYTQLISKIKGVPLPLDDASASNSPNPIDTSVPSANPNTTRDFYNSSTTIDNSRPPPLLVEPIFTPSIPPPKIPIVPHQVPPPQKPKISDGVEIKKISSGLMLAQYYNSDSEEESDEQPAAVVIEPTLSVVAPPPGKRFKICADRFSHNSGFLCRYSNSNLRSTKYNRQNGIVRTKKWQGIRGHSAYEKRCKVFVFITERCV